MLEIITTFWQDENLVLDPECPETLKFMYNNLRDIGLHQMWLGLLPIGMVECQAPYYRQIGSKKSAKKGSLDFVQKMLRSTHGLWMERNYILHLRATIGIRVLNNIALQTAVPQQ